MRGKIRSPVWKIVVGIMRNSEQNDGIGEIPSIRLQLSCSLIEQLNTIIQTPAVELSIRDLWSLTIAFVRIRSCEHDQETFPSEDSLYPAQSCQVSSN
jgi:hypothetical protein